MSCYWCNSRSSFTVESMPSLYDNRDLTSEMLTAAFIRCKQSAFVYRQDVDDTPTIACPLPGCNYIWCKTCQQAIEIGGPQHSCDGSSELDHLMKSSGWKYCPSTISMFPPFRVQSSHSLARLQDAVLKRSRMQSYDSQSADWKLRSMFFTHYKHFYSVSLPAATPISATCAVKRWLGPLYKEKSKPDYPLTTVSAN